MGHRRFCYSLFIQGAKSYGFKGYQTLNNRVFITKEDSDQIHKEFYHQKALLLILYPIETQTKQVFYVFFLKFDKILGPLPPYALVQN